MSKSITVAIIFKNDMTRPMLLVAPNLEEILYRIRDCVEKYGEFELIYRVY